MIASIVVLSFLLCLLWLLYSALGTPCLRQRVCTVFVLCLRSLSSCHHDCFNHGAVFSSVSSVTSIFRLGYPPLSERAGLYCLRALSSFFVFVPPWLLQSWCCLYFYNLCLLYSTFGITSLRQRVCTIFVLCLRATMIASIVVLSLLLWLIIFTLALSLRHSATSSPFPFIS